MQIYPYTIENKFGQKLTFLQLIKEPGGDKLETEGFAKPGAGPAMHVHWQQDESLTVISGKMAVQIPGQQPVYYGPGESVTFFRGTWHRFWNAGSEELKTKGWVKPANNLEYFLTELYKAIDQGKSERPQMKAIAFLLTRYKSEFAVRGVPLFVKKIILPLNYFIGKLSGGYKKFEDAPPPLK